MARDLASRTSHLPTLTPRRFTFSGLLLSTWLTSGAGNGRDDVCGVPVEVLASPVVDRGCARVGVARGELNIAQRHAGIERGHDERTLEHVWVHVSEAGSFTDRLHPPMCGAAVEALTIVTDQDRSLTPFTDRKVDGSSGA